MVDARARVSGLNTALRARRLATGLTGSLIAASAFLTSPALAQGQAIPGSLAAHYNLEASTKGAIPLVLSPRENSHYRDVFSAIDQERWDKVEALLTKEPDGLLTAIAQAQYFTHANSPKISGDAIARWFARGSYLPQAEQLARLGARRGVTSFPDLPRPQAFSWQGSTSKRIRPRSVDDGTMPQSASAAILEAISNSDPMSAYNLLVEVDQGLSAAARAEWRQRVAWSFYIENDDKNALALAERVAEGDGPWVAEGYWVAGLAAWRQDFCALASEAFADAANTAENTELKTAAHYWAHRALIRCREPGAADAHLRAASQHDETLYGMLAADQLGLALRDLGEQRPVSRDDWHSLQNRPNVQIAAALIEIGRPALADEVLRHEVRIGDPRGFSSLARLAREWGLPSTQLFMAHNAPRGTLVDSSLRYPVASWKPRNGWRVDPALAFAHALQESNFSAEAVSPANARGLMQIMPGTARDHNRRLNLGASYEDLNDPSVNLAYGQQHLEMLRDSPATQGYLPKIMAAYNAGLSPVSRWNSEVRDGGDPLLWMESIPYWETRGYVAIVMRNYWMYERAARLPSPSRMALAQGRWPLFPHMSGTRTAKRSMEAQ